MGLKLHQVKALPKVGEMIDKVAITVCEIFVIFHIFTKSSNKVAITHLYIEQQL